MGLSVPNIITLLVFAVFVGIILFDTGDKNRFFIKFILLAYPFLQLYLIPGKYGFYNFDLLTFSFFLTLYKRKDVSVPSGKTFLFLFSLILAASVIGCLKAESLDWYTVPAFIQLFSIFIFAKILLEECSADTSYIYKIIKYIRLTLIFSFVFLICQFIFGVHFSLALVVNPNVLGEGTIRYPSFFQDPQKYAQFLAAVSFLLLIKDEGQSKLPFINFLLLVLSLVAMLLTGGRAALGGWALGFILIILFSSPFYRVTALIACVALFFIGYTFQDSLPIFKRTSLSDSYQFRYGIWQQAYEMFTNHPVFGIGLGNYRNYVSVHYPDQIWMVEGELVYYDHPESGYLKFLTEIGLLGFCAIVLLILISLFQGFKSYFKSSDNTNVFLIAALLSWLVGFYTVYSFGDIRIQVLIVTIICLLLTSYNRANHSNA